MITLATLPQSSPQSVFEQSARHLLTQNRQSIDAGRCLYRGPDNTKCAVGCLMTNEEAAFVGEYSWEDLLYDKKVPESHYGLLLRLQSIHDKRDVSSWHENLIELGLSFGLDTDFINNEFAAN